MKKRVLLAVGGGIAAYKSAILCSRLVQSGCEVKTMMTSSATEFLGPATLAALSGHPVGIHSFAPQQFPLGAHIELPRGIDLFLVAPATANLLAKFAGGLADCLVSTTYLQSVAPVLLAPAMSDPMWSKRPVQRNVETLRNDGCHFVGPESGWLSCRDEGMGRMSEPDAILTAAMEILDASDRL